MSCVILQPSFILWRGYFHQIRRAEVFVFYHCVQYDKHGWRNCNRIKLLAQDLHWLAIPLAAGGACQGLLIRDTQVAWKQSW